MKYQHVANLCDGSDYIRHWEGPKCDTVEEAMASTCPFPDYDELEAIVRADSEESGIPVDEYDLQVGIWGDDGKEYGFYTEGF